MSKAATVYDVADRAGVSIATVSRVLRSPEAVRPVTRERVLDAVAALGYVPSGSARGLAERRTGVLGLYFPGFDAAEDAPPLDALSVAARPPFTVLSDDQEAPHSPMLFLDEVLRGAELEAWKQGFVLMVGVGRDDPDRSTVRDMAGRVDGLMVLARSVPDDVLLTGFDGIEAATLASPPLTTIRQPMIDLGRAAVQVLARRLEHPDAPPLTTTLPLQVLLRESSRRPV